MKKSFILILALFLAALWITPAFADETTGDFSINYFPANVSTAGSTLSAGGVMADINFRFPQRWGFGIDYNTNNYTLNNTGYNINSFNAKLKYLLSDPKAAENGINVYAMYRSTNDNRVSSSYTGWGLGLDGWFKVGANVDGYGMLDYSGAHGGIASYRVTRFEAGIKYYFQKNYFVRAGYRGENFSTQNSGMGTQDITVNGPVIGVGLKW